VSIAVFLRLIACPLRSFCVRITVDPNLHYFSATIQHSQGRLTPHYDREINPTPPPHLTRRRTLLVGTEHEGRSYSYRPSVDCV